MPNADPSPAQISRLPVASALAVAIGAWMWKLSRWGLVIYLVAMVWMHASWHVAALCVYFAIYLELALWAQRKTALGIIQIATGFLGLVDARDKVFLRELERLQGTDAALQRAAFGASGKPN